MKERETAAFGRISEIIAEFAGIDRIRITMDSDLIGDLGIAGADGDDLFTALDQEFDVDWTGLDLGVHFGDEGLGPPFPWHLKNNCIMYEPQPCRVSDLVQAVVSGKWPGTKVIHRSRGKRVTIYLTSALQLALFGFLLAVFAAWLIGQFR